MPARKIIIDCDAAVVTSAGPSPVSRTFRFRVDGGSRPRCRRQAACGQHRSQA